MKMEELEKKSNEKDDALKTKFNDLIEKIKERWNNEKDKILKLIELTRVNFKLVYNDQPWLWP